MFEIGDIISLKSDNKSCVYNSVYQIIDIDYDSSYDEIYRLNDLNNKHHRLHLHKDKIDSNFELNIVYSRKKKLERICLKLEI